MRPAARWATGVSSSRRAVDLHVGDERVVEDVEAVHRHGHVVLGAGASTMAAASGSWKTLNSAAAVALLMSHAAAHEDDPADPREGLRVHAGEQREVGHRGQRHDGHRVAGGGLLRRWCRAGGRSRGAGRVAGWAPASRGRPCRRRRARGGRRPAPRAAGGAAPTPTGTSPRPAVSSTTRVLRTTSASGALPPTQVTARRSSRGCRAARRRAQASSTPVSTSRTTGRLGMGSIMADAAVRTPRSRVLRRSPGAT